jgi:ankyrin repeat protein
MPLKRGDSAEIERLMKSGADANEEDAMASPLHWAAMNGHVESVAVLLSYCAAL